MLSMSLIGLRRKTQCEENNLRVQWFCVPNTCKKNIVCIA